MKIQNSKFKLQRNIKIQASRAWVVCAMGLCASGFAGFTAEMPRVTITQDADSFRISNGLLMAEVEKSSGVLVSLRYQDLEMLAQGGGGAEGGYWSSVGRGRPGSSHSAVVRIDPATNGGARAEVSCRLWNDPQSPTSPVDAEYRYALGRGEQGLYAYAVLEHKPGYPGFGVGEARYCMKLNPTVFDYMTVDADRRRVMPSGYDWDHGAPLNLKEARRMTTGVHKGEPEHKYDYSAVLQETPAYGWSSTKHEVGLWLINPSMEYIGGGPTKAELTGHLDVNPGGLPTLLNMWVGSHYGGTSLSVATNEAWTKVVGPFVIYCNSRSRRREALTDLHGTSATDQSSLTSAPAADEMHRGLWQDALAHAHDEMKLWPYAWVSDSNYPSASQRGSVTGRIALKDLPGLKPTNLWVGVAAPDYTPPRLGFGGGYFRRGFTNGGGFGFTNSPGSGTNFQGRGFGFGRFNAGFPTYIDWQRDAKFYQFWTKAGADGSFSIPNVRPGTYTLHALAENVLGEYSLTNVSIGCAEKRALGELEWKPLHYGRTIWEIGVPDRTAREFRHGDYYWQWGLYFDYAREFPTDVNFVIGKSDWRKDWNYVQPPRITGRDVAVVSEDEEQNPEGGRRFGRDNVQSSTWSVNFQMREAPRGRATLRLAFCGTHVGCNVEVFANGKSVGETGPLPSTSAMQRDGIRAYWIEKPISFDAVALNRGTNVIKLLSHANSWSQGVMYDYLRLELDDAERAAR